MPDNINKSDLQENLRIGREVKQMTQSKGWQQHVLPQIEQLRDGAIFELKDAEGLEGFYKIKQTVEAIDTILGLIDFEIEQGEQARKQLQSME